MSENSNRSKSSVDLGRLLEESGAVLHGHFLLTSGRHSDVYFEKFRVLTQPTVLSALCREIAQRFEGSGIEYVAGPTTGGIIIAFEVARQMGLPAVYVETEDGVKTLRRGQTVPKGAKVLVVDDVLTTGLSVEESVGAIKRAGGQVVGVGVLIDRAQSDLDFGCPLFASYKVEAVSYAPDAVPEWLASIPVTKPGTRS
ncbi:MAG TPA: orotate phosphoribosyltransferase [Fimbriimonadaceae bacterium]|nr:orotate phosphoribosyltransferase [Fimbriimonadaceae bacterium]